MNYQYDADMGTELELLMDLANVLDWGLFKRGVRAA